MALRKLYDALRMKFGSRSDPDTWWPVYRARTQPPEFERLITNVLVQNSSWGPVERAVAALDGEGLLTAAALATAETGTIAACVKPTGLQAQKAGRLKAIGAFVASRFGTEAAFCSGVTRADLMGISGIKDETADRTLLYACRTLAWPVDTYCLRVLAHHGVIASVPASPAENRPVAAAVKAMVAEEMSAELDDWRRLHALMQLEGVDLRRR